MAGLAKDTHSPILSRCEASSLMYNSFKKKVGGGGGGGGGRIIGFP